VGRLLTSGELAKELGLSLRTIQRYIADGVIEPEFRTRGGHTRWNLDNVVAQLNRARAEEDNH
jgi:excisionase family DNA binding protein